MEHLKSRNWQAFGVHVVTALILIWAYNQWPATQSRAVMQAFRYQLAGQTTLAECSSSGAQPPTPDKCTVEIIFKQPKEVISFNVIFGSISFFLITAFAHAFYATDAFGSGGYSSSVMSGWNPYRWFEYASSASIMSVLIGLVDGTRDVATLWLLALITVAMQFNGFTVEALLRGHGKVGQGARDAVMGSTIAGWTLFVALWSAIVYGFSNLFSDVKTEFPGPPASTIPTWIWYILIMQFIYYSLFGIVQANHIKGRLSGGPFNYLETENSYIFLSYFAKLSLASGIGYGLLWRTKDC